MFWLGCFSHFLGFLMGEAKVERNSRKMKDEGERTRVGLFFVLCSVTVSNYYKKAGGSRKVPA